MSINLYISSDDALCLYQSLQKIFQSVSALRGERGVTNFIIYFKFHRILYCYLVMAEFDNFKLIQEQ